MTAPTLAVDAGQTHVRAALYPSDDGGGPRVGVAPGVASGPSPVTRAARRPWYQTARGIAGALALIEPTVGQGGERMVRPPGDAGVTSAPDPPALLVLAGDGVLDLLRLSCVCQDLRS